MKINTSGLTMADIIKRSEAIDSTSASKKSDFQQDGIFSLDDAKMALDELNKESSPNDADKNLQTALQSMVSYPDIFKDAGGSGNDWGNAQQIDANIKKIDPDYKPSDSPPLKDAPQQDAPLGTGATPAPDGSDTGNDPLKGPVDPNKPIYIKQNADGSYNQEALAALDKQGLSAAGMTSSQVNDLAKANPKAGNFGDDGGTWTIANGWAKDILYGAAALAGAGQCGYTSIADQRYAVTQCSTETGETDNLSGTRNHKQDLTTGVGKNGQGAWQIDSQYHDQLNCNNPFVASQEAWKIGEGYLGGKSSLKAAGVAYNVGNATDTKGQPENRNGNILYADYWERLVGMLPSS